VEYSPVFYFSRVFRDMKHEVRRTIIYQSEDSDTMQDARGKIEGLYRDFKDAYESRNETSLFDLIHPEWESGDGTAIDDLEETILNNFSMFDEIQYQGSGFNISLIGPDRYYVSYKLKITGRIYDNDLEHVEESSVTEEVMVEGGRALIRKTIGGRFWH